MKIQERTGAGNHRSNAPAQPGTGERLPSAPRERKPALAALAVLLILVGALGATILVMRAGDRIEVVKVTAPISAGEQVSKSKLSSVMVAKDDSIHYVKWSQLGSLTKLKAKDNIPAGVLAVGELFAEDAGLTAGKSSVGLSLKDGQYPSGLQAGDKVAAYRVSDSPTGSNTGGNKGDSSNSGNSGSDTPIVADAVVINVVDKSDSTISSGNLPVTVAVDAADAAALANAAAAGQVALVRVPKSSS